jgi:hypothetical protein
MKIFPSPEGDKMTRRACPRCKSHLIKEIEESEVFGVSKSKMHVYDRIEKGIKCLICGYRNTNSGIK